MVVNVRRGVAAFVVGLGLLWCVGSAQAAPVIELYTMGQGDDLFARFGHTAVCVLEDAQAEDGLCYNYGTANFDNPLVLVWQTLRGEPLFTVSLSGKRRMEGRYIRDDRSVWRQRLPLSDVQATALAVQLATDAHPDNRDFIYHHFRTNCSTRPRDALAKLFGPPFATDDPPQMAPEPLRHYVRQGFSGSLPLLLGSELLLGRVLDRAITRQEAMFLPLELAQAVEERFEVPLQEVYRRHGPPLEAPPTRGPWWILGLGLALAVPWLVMAAVAGPKGRRVAVVGAVVCLMLPTMLLWGLAAVSSEPEIWLNENLLIFLPVDLALLWSKRRREILLGRAAWLGLVGVLAAAGVLVQPLWAPLAVAALLLAPIGVAEFRSQPDAGRAGRE